MIVIMVMSRVMLVIVVMTILGFFLDWSKSFQLEPRAARRNQIARGDVSDIPQHEVGVLNTAVVAVNCGYAAR